MIHTFGQDQRFGEEGKTQADNPPARAKLVSEISDAKGLKMTLKRPVRWTSAMLIAVATAMSLNVAAETATLRVSIEGGSFNSKFKFWDASEGCPSYHDVPGAKHFLGGVRASDKGADKKLSVGRPVHVFMYRPKDYPGLSAAGLFTEIRRRALQVVLNGDATLRYTGFDDKVPTWEAAGEVDVAPATDCEIDEDSEVDEHLSPGELEEDDS